MGNGAKSSQVVGNETPDTAVRGSLTEVLREGLRRWWTSDSFQMGAALAYYAVFSVGPITLLVVSLVGSVFGEQAAKGALFARLRETLGAEVASAVEGMLAAAYRPTSGAIATLIGVMTLVFLATGVFSQLRHSLNQVFQNINRPRSAVRTFLRRRVTAFLMIVALGVLLLSLLAVDTAISALGVELTRLVLLSPWLLRLFSFATSLLLLTLVLFAIFKFLPDNDLGWKPVLMGSLVAAFLFAVGKVLLSLYLGRTTTVSVYGAAGSVIVILVAAYYFSQILFLGAHISSSWKDLREPA